jgi:fibronectin type 3 domain-containing protein
VSGVTVASYNVYRATATKGENYATPLNTAPITTLFFADTTDTVGTTYYYTVTAVSTGGVQSVPSSEASALVPVPPGQPQQPSATSF